jgi:hypothetical protein
MTTEKIKITEEDLTKELEKAVKPKTKFDSVIASIVTPMLLEIFKPWMEHCFSTYDEKYFHMKMVTGFDFIQDWKQNHRIRYKSIIGAIRPIRNKVNIDKEILLQVILEKLKERGWTVEDWEITRFRSNIDTFYREIYS